MSCKLWDEGLGYLERETFDAFLGLPASQRKAIRGVILALASVPASKVAVPPRKGRKPV